MARFIIKQPNGKYALFSTDEERFLLADGSLEDLIEEAKENALLGVEDNVRQAVARVDAGAASFFTPSWEDACSRHNANAEFEMINPSLYE